MAGIIEQGTGVGGAADVVGNLRMRKDGPSAISCPGPSTTPFYAPIEAGPIGAYRVFSDFPLAAGGTLPAPWATQDTSAAGSPTLDYSSDAAGGAYILKLASTNEAEAITLYHGDQRTFDITKKPQIAFRLKIEPDVTGAGGALAAGDKIVFGLASDRNATLDSVTTNAWFMFAGANTNVYVESDDGTTDTDDSDTGVDWVANTNALYQIDCSNLAAVRFLVNGVCVKTTSMAAATGNVQPFIEVTKAAAANMDHRVTVDFIDCLANR